MGTNYYFKIKKKRAKEIEGFLTDIEKKLINFNGLEISHIGKSSCGWQFTFQATGFYRSYEELINFYEKNKDELDIVDEYGRKISIEKFKDLVESKKDDESQYEIEKDSGYSNIYLDKEGYIFSEWYFS